MLVYQVPEGSQNGNWRFYDPVIFRYFQSDPENKNK